MLYLFFSLLSSLELITCCRRISEEVVVEVEVVVMVVAAAAADKSFLFFELNSIIFQALDVAVKENLKNSDQGIEHNLNQ
jgi:hypothetical protein